MLGVLSFDSIRSERTWPDELVQRLQLLGEVFAGALERKRLELALAERLRFETLLAEQSATFSSLSAAEVDREIERALRRIVDFLRADWGSLAEFSHDSRMARITHSWVAEGAAPAPSTISLADVPVGHGDGCRVARWCASRGSRSSPEEGAAVDRRTYLSLGIKSHVEVPLKVAGDGRGGPRVQHPRGRARLAGRAGAAAPAPRGGVRQYPGAPAVGDRGATAPARSAPTSVGSRRWGSSPPRWLMSSTSP